MAAPGAPQHVPVDERTVRKLLAQFPDLKIGPIDYIGEGEGRTYEVNGSLIFRFPKDERAATNMERERALLAAAGPMLPLAVPGFEYIGQPSDLLPFPFAGYRKIQGRSGEACRPSLEHWPAVAAQAGEFLSAVHDVPVAKARDYGLAECPIESADELLKRLAEFAPLIREAIPNPVDNEMARYLSGRVDLPPASPSAPVVSHFDLKGEHLIVSERGDALIGVIDWTDCCITDPLVDFTGLMIWLGEAFVRQVLESYRRPTDEHFLGRVCFYARCFALDELRVRLTGESAAPLPLLETQLRWAFAQT